MQETYTFDYVKKKCNEVTGHPQKMTEREKHVAILVKLKLRVYTEDVRI